ncbi:MAG: hypothetical protein ABI632_01035 [Pseudolysinimonas sp.]
MSMHRGSLVLARTCVLLAAIVGALALALPAVADGDPTDGVTAIENWTPDDKAEWTAGKITAVDEEPFPGCTAGLYRQLTRDVYGAAIEVDWHDCATPELAKATTAVWGTRLGLIEASSEPTTLLDGGQVVGYRPGWGGVYHVWAQGSLAIIAVRTCGFEQPADCRDEMDTEVEDLAATIGLPVAPSTAGVAAAGEPLSSWLPAKGPWTRGDVANLPTSDTCQVGGTGFTAEDQRVVVLTWAECHDPAAAAVVEGRYWTGAVLDSRQTPPVFGFFRDVAGVQTIDGVQRISRHWVQGDSYIGVETICGGDLQACMNDNVADSRSIGAWLPGTIAESDSVRSLGSLGLLLAAVPLVTLLLLHLPRRLVARARTSGYGINAPGGASFHDVAPLVNRARVSRLIRRVFVGIIVVLGYVAIIVGLVQAGAPTWMFGVALFFSPFAIIGVAHVAIWVIWRPPRLLRTGRRRSRFGAALVASYIVRAFAALLAAAALESYALAAVYLVTDGQVGGQVFQGSLEQQAAHGDISSMLRLGFVGLNNSGFVVLVFFLVLAVPIFLAYLLDRVGQRLGRRSLRETLQHDGRPYFLYLRGFDEDALRVDESLGRKGFLELLSPFGRPRFEEVVVEHLSEFGPVIAISPRQTRLADLGAAKISLSNEAWRDQVLEWLDGARAVVMSATPKEVRAGLEWEIEQVATRPDTPPLMLVVAPWPRDELARRWSGFIDAAATWPRFQSLRDEPMPSGLHLATYSAERGWRGYGAERRWDWSYAASILSAIDDGDLR